MLEASISLSSSFLLHTSWMIFSLLNFYYSFSVFSIASSMFYSSDLMCKECSYNVPPVCNWVLYAFLQFSTFHFPHFIFVSIMHVYEIWVHLHIMPFRMSEVHTKFTYGFCLLIWICVPEEMTKNICKNS